MAACRDADLPEGVAEGAAGVFRALVQAALTEAGKGLHEDELEGEADAAAANPQAEASSHEVSLHCKISKLYTAWVSIAAEASLMWNQ